MLVGFPMLSSAFRLLFVKCWYFCTIRNLSTKAGVWENIVVRFTGFKGGILLIITVGIKSDFFGYCMLVKDICLCLQPAGRLLLISHQEIRWLPPWLTSQEGCGGQTGPGWQLGTRGGRDIDGWILPGPDDGKNMGNIHVHGALQIWTVYSFIYIYVFIKHSAITFVRCPHTSSK